MSSMALNTSYPYPIGSLRGPKPSYRSRTIGITSRAREAPEISLSQFKFCQRCPLARIGATGLKVALGHELLK